MSHLDLLLSRLTSVKGRNGAYTACCPAHEDRHPSLAIKEEGGKIIMHCFAGCAVEDIVLATGMDMTDLFPPRQNEYGKPQKRMGFFASDLLRLVAREASIVSVAAFDMGRGKVLPKVDLDRLQLACQRLQTAVEAAQ